MAATIKIKNSSTASAVPTSSDLVQGELAVNVTDKRIFTENASGTVVELGTNPTILTLPDGSASAPTLTNDGDTNTGIFFPAADTVGITTGGSERLRVDSGGNLGLGVTPSAWSGYTGFQVKATVVGGIGTSDNSLFGSNVYYNGSAFTYINSTTATLYRQLSGAHSWYYAASGTAGNAITFTQAMTLDASGNLGIALTSPTTKLDVAGAVSATPVTNGVVRIVTTGSNPATGSGGGLLFAQQNSGGTYSNYASITGSRVNNAANDKVDLVFSTGSPGDSIAIAERMRIDTGGNLLVGTTSNGSYPSTRMTLSTNSGTTNWNTGPYSTATNYLIASSAGGGVQLVGTATSWSALSDERTKTDLVPIENAAAKVATLRAVTGRYKTDDVGVSRSFLIAQDVQAVLPQAVNSTSLPNDEDDTEYLGIQYTDVIPLLVAAIKELKAEIDVLKGQA